ncbi:MAG: response regulator [Planctomycetes bacterium]|nr:response regulator [Planctomycetota bacterium]
MSGNGRRPIVLCVDDEPPILSALRRALRREPYELLTTERPREALAWIEAVEIDLVISDQRMPEMLGTELIAEVRRRSPHTCVAILTGYPGSNLGAPGIGPGIAPLIHKPWEDDGLKETIRRFLAPTA